MLELALRERQAATEAAAAAAEAQASAATAPRKANKITPFGGAARSAAQTASDAVRDAAAAAAAAARKAADWDAMLDRLVSAPRNDIFLLEVWTAGALLNRTAGAFTSAPWDRRRAHCS